MSKLLRSIFPAEFFTNTAYFRAIALGILYLGTLLAQLFTFEKFSGVVAGYGLPGGSVTVAIVAWLLPLVTFVSLPFLLSMRMGDQLRLASRTAVVATPLLWAVIALWLILAVGERVNAGLLGATLEIPAGLWLLALAILWLWAAMLVVRELPARR